MDFRVEKALSRMKVAPRAPRGGGAVALDAVGAWTMDVGHRRINCEHAYCLYYPLIAHATARTE